ncbi:ecto-ADP-ribosyltransferase 4-like [Cololabis saira]|uniref:ecto-ADP-ribosyltransferase 4-like n=1 Tax=Cololabis saira TaxID=129043 RepID=UPI002AD3A6B0|nr:ecto-ADP-ribosyltransferase 4-like [Cololabis saira]
MKFEKRSACGLKLLRNWTGLCVLMVVVLVLYNDPYLILWWPQRPEQRTKPDVSPLDLATDSIDDMYAGCRSETASLIDLFGVFEWHFNTNFSIAWALVERNARKPVHEQLKDDHAIVVLMYTKFAHIREDFNTAVKTGKHKYNTEGFHFHYFYFYLTQAIQALRHKQTSCRTTYHRSWKRFDQNINNTIIRFGTFTWAASNRESFELSGNVSCFEIYTCFGADITYYSSTKLIGQVLIPTYEVFRITDVVMNDPWCSVVYKLQSTKIPRSDQNCKLTKSYLGAGLMHLLPDRVVVMSACALLMIISSLVLVRHKQKCYVAVVFGALLVLAITVMMAGYLGKQR